MGNVENGLAFDKSMGAFRAVLGNFVYVAIPIPNYTDYGTIGMEINTSLVVPTAPENRPASISAMVCITF